jgi:hypothetical protein
MKRKPDHSLWLRHQEHRAFMQSIAPGPMINQQARTMVASICLVIRRSDPPKWKAVDREIQCITAGGLRTEVYNLLNRAWSRPEAERIVDACAQDPTLDFTVIGDICRMGKRNLWKLRRILLDLGVPPARGFHGYADEEGFPGDPVTKAVLRLKRNRNV